MIKYKALRTINGDYGLVHPGGIFEVPDYMAKKMERLEAKGVITRYRARPSFVRPTFPVRHQAVVPAENKAIVTSVAGANK